MSSRVSTDVAAGLGFLRSRHGAIIVANDAPRWTILAVNDKSIVGTPMPERGKHRFDRLPIAPPEYAADATH